MSKELRPWIQEYLIQIAETKGANLSSVEWSPKVKKAQIIQFLTYGSRNKEEDTVIWARVSDKKYHIPVRFSAEATAEYRRENQSHLTEVRTAIIALRKFRLIHCRVPSTRTRHKLTPDAFLALECSELRVLGSFGEPTMGNPVGIETNQDLLKYAVELRNPGGGANFLKIRADERNPRRKAGKGKEEEKNTKYASFGRDKSGPSTVSEAAPIAGPSSLKTKVDIAKTGSSSRINSVPTTTSKSESIATSKATLELQPGRAPDYGREINRKYASMPEPKGKNNKQRLQCYRKQFQAEGIDLPQPQTGKDRKGKYPAVKRIPLNSPSDKLSKGMKGPRISLSPDFLPNAARVRTGPDPLSLPRRSKGSQESKFSQQLHTPGTSQYSSCCSSPLQSQPTSPQSEILTENWSSSDRGIPCTGDNIEDNEEKERQEEKNDSSPAPPSPSPTRRHGFSSVRGALSPPVNSVDEGVHDHSPAPVPPTPAQRRKLLSMQNTSPLPSVIDDNVEMLSFNFDSTQSVKNEFLSPIQVPKPSPLPRLPRIPPAMPPPWLKHVQNGDTSYVQQIVPESSQFRPSPPTPAQRCRNPSQTPNQSRMPFSLSNSTGVRSSPILSSSSLPHVTAKLSNAATAPSSLMHTRFTVQRKVPPPPPPLPRDGQTSPKILAPNSDTSGTQSQSQCGSQSQSRLEGNENFLWQRSQPSDNSQPLNEKLFLFSSQSHSQRKPNVQGEDDDDDDALTPAPDAGTIINLASEADPQHSKLGQNGQFLPPDEEQLHDSIPEDDPIASTCPEVQVGSNISDVKFGATPREIQAARKADSSTIEAADNIDNVHDVILWSADVVHEFSNRTGFPTSTLLDLQRSKAILETVQNDTDRTTVIEPVAHDVDAWSLPSFLRHKTTQNTRVEEVQPSVKAFQDGKQKAPLAEAGHIALGQEEFKRAAHSSASKLVADNFAEPHCEKRSSTDQGEAGPSYKKRKIMSECQPALSKEASWEQEKSASRRKLEGFDPGFDDIPPGISFMSWERLQTISLKVGRARARQAQIRQPLP